MRRKHVLAILSSIVASLMVSITASLAWFDERDGFQNNNLTASSVSNYFADGDGSELNPYRIDQPVHIYNLAWLQARGVFDPVKTYFKVSDASGNPITIDFAGYLDGHTGATGAIPPIGTELNPFKGVFDGNGSTFKNVWVSSDPVDWKEKPIDIGDTNTNKYVGFFGAIEQEGERKGEVRNFFLENVEVTSHVDGSFVGLIAGYSNSTTLNIGVKNGKLSFKSSGDVVNYSYKSEASLVGKVGNNVSWEGVPSDDEEGGELKINPHDIPGAPAKGTLVAKNNTKIVPNSAVDSAYLSGYLEIRTQALGTVYKYNTPISFPEGNYVRYSINDTNSINASDNKTDYSICSKAFWDNYDTNKSNAKVILQPYDATKAQGTNEKRPNPASPNTITLSDNSNLTIPSNCIWFKPLNPGLCGISFTVDNMSKSRYTSLYRYKRNSNGSLPARSNWKEVELEFDKSGNICNNSTVLYYEIMVTQDDVDEGYEYAIGASTTLTQGNTESGLVFLYLPGASETGGDTEATAFIKNIDYVYKYSGSYLPDFNSPDYHPNHTKLFFSFDAQYDSVMLFNMDDVVNSTYVYYYTSGPTIVDAITSSLSVGRAQATTDKFPPREDT